MRTTRILFMFIMGGLCTAAWALPQTLTLEDAVAAALKGNADVLLAQRDIEVSEARSLQAEAWPNPEIVLSNEAIPWRFRDGEPEISLGIVQPFEFPGKRRLRKLIFRTDEEIALAGLERIRMIVTRRVRKAYIRASLSQAVVGQLSALQDILEEYQGMADIRFRSGEVSATDVFRARLEVLKLQNEIVEARRALRSELAGLRILMGTDLPASVSLTTELSHAPLAESLDDLRTGAEARPSLLALRLESERAKLGVELARKNFAPDFHLGFSSPSKSFSAWGFEVGSTLPLFPKKQRGELREAEALHNRNIEALEARRRQILLSVESAHSDVMAAEQRLALFERALLGEAEEMLKAVIEEYRYGKTGSLNVFDVYRIYRETRMEYLKTLADHGLSLAELDAAGEEE